MLQLESCRYLLNYDCRNCSLREDCSEDRTMVDPSIILAILKHEDPEVINEEELDQIKFSGKGFITHVGLGEIFLGMITFIKEEIEKGGLNDFNVSASSTHYKDKLKLEIFDNLIKLLRGLELKEMDEEALKFIERLISPGHKYRIDMGNRDRIILGIAESHKCTRFLFIDKAIKNDEETIRKLDFKIKLKHLGN